MTTVCILSPAALPPGPGVRLPEIGRPRHDANCTGTLLPRRHALYRRRGPNRRAFTALLVATRVSGWLCLLVALLAAFAGAAGAEQIVLGRFSAADRSGWEAKSFVGTTRYDFVEDTDGTTVLSAISEGTASGLVFERLIDVTRTPYLTWRWKVARPVNPPDELTKAGDDFAARIYFVAEREGFFHAPESISYVWASTQAENSVWPNPYTGKVKMLAVDSGNGLAGQWRQHCRNMRRDFQTLFGRDISGITHIAIMTDTDNSQSSARAWYGDISVASSTPGC